MGLSWPHSEIQWKRVKDSLWKEMHSSRVPLSSSSRLDREAKLVEDGMDEGKLRTRPGYLSLSHDLNSYLGLARIRPTGLGMRSPCESGLE